MDPMDPYYLTESMYVLNQKMYCEGLPIKKHNWHRVLSEYGWEKIPKKWITRLNQLSETKEHNSLYGIYDCMPDGDCFFHCMAHALNERDNYMSNYDCGDIRQLICDHLRPDQFEMILEYYKVMKDADDWSDGWDPYEITCIEDFKRLFLEGGHGFWCDWVILTLITDIIQVNILILTHMTDTNEISVYNTMIDHNDDRDTVVLLYENENHFKLVGHFNGDRMISYFKELPYEFNQLI